MALTKTEAQDLTRRFVRDYPGALALAYRFRQSTTDLYGSRADEVPASMKGGYVPKEAIHNGRTYQGRIDIPLENLRDPRDLLVTLRHEVLGHYGANTFTPDEKRALLDGLVAARSESGIKPLWESIDRRYSDRSLDVRAEEVFALHCEGVAPIHHVNDAQAAERGRQSFLETCIDRTRPMQAADLSSIACMVAQGLHDRTRTQQTFPQINELQRRDETMEPKKPFHEVVAEKLIEQLKAGTAPWQKPWNPGEPNAYLPMNPTTGKRYKGINAIHLMAQGRSDARWMTYKQAAAEGAQVRKGEKGTPVQYWKFSEEQTKLDEQGKPVLDAGGKPIKENVMLERPRVFFATVFNAEQIDGLPPIQQKTEQQWDAVERAEHILNASGAKITHAAGDRAFYRSSTDSITMPERGQFESADRYYATALHELGHWTGHPSRLDRDMAHPFGSQGYAKEELRAEIASMILGDELGIGHDPGQHVAYVGSWIKALQDDPLEVFRAAADAEKIHDYVLAFEQKQVQELSNMNQYETDALEYLQYHHALNNLTVEDKAFLQNASVNGDSPVVAAIELAKQNKLPLTDEGFIYGFTNNMNHYRVESPGRDSFNFQMKGSSLETKQVQYLFDIADSPVTHEIEVNFHTRTANLVSTIDKASGNVLQLNSDLFFSDVKALPADTLSAIRLSELIESHDFVSTLKREDEYINAIASALNEYKSGRLDESDFALLINNLAVLDGTEAAIQPFDEPDKWTGNVRVQGCIERKDFVSGETFIEAAKGEEIPDFYGVYLEQDDGSDMWYLDCDSIDKANSVERRLEKIYEVSQTFSSEQLSELNVASQEVPIPRDWQGEACRQYDLEMEKIMGQGYFKAQGLFIEAEHAKERIETIHWDGRTPTLAELEEEKELQASIAETEKLLHKNVYINPVVKERMYPVIQNRTINFTDDIVAYLGEMEAQLGAEAGQLRAEGEALQKPVEKQAERQFINVPFREKDEAKALGARWDRQQQSWYVPGNVDVGVFAKWVQGAATAAAEGRQEERGGQQQGEAQSTQQRTYLAVPYGERGAAKAAGAMWDKAAKSWYAGQKADMERLQRWMPDNVRSEQGPAMSPREEFAEALRSIGCVVGGEHPIMDGKKHRIGVEGDKRGEKAGFYVGHLDGHPAGYIKNNRTGIDMKWKSKGYALDPAEKAKLQAEAAAKLAERAAEQERVQEATAQRVTRQTGALQAIEHPTPYLNTKGVQLHDGVLTDKEGQKTYIPAFDAGGKQWTMQYIQEDGTKRFAKDSRKEGCFHPVGGMDAVAAAPALIVAEGYATAAQVAEAAGQATIAAFDSGNLESVAKALHEKFPNKPVIIAGDDDRHLELTQGVNPGRSKAEAAAKAVGGKPLFPIFAPGENTYPADLPPITPQSFREHERAQKRLDAAEAGEVQLTDKEAADLKRALLSTEQLRGLAGMKEHTDFNDLATRSSLGREAVNRQVSAAVAQAVQAAERKAEQKQERVEKQKQEQKQRRGTRVG